MIDHRMMKLQSLVLAALLAVPALGADKGFKAGAIPSLPSLPGAAIPALKAPAAGAAAHGLVPISQTGPIEALGQGIAPQLEAIARPDAGSEASAAAGGDIQAILQGGKAQEPVSSVFSVPAGAAGSGSSSAVGKARAAYEWSRTVLSAISTYWGMNFSLSPVSPVLAQDILAQAATKRVVFSDIDDTLMSYNTQLSPEIAASIAAVRRSGKQFIALTDRPALSRPGSDQRPSLATFDAIPPADRAGIILGIGSGGGGQIYRFDEQGQPQQIHTVPGLEPSQQQRMLESVAAVKARLPSLGAVLKHDDSSIYGFTVILVEGTPWPAVQAVAAAIEGEFRARGLEFPIEARQPKDAALAPYVLFSILNKKLLVEHLAKTLGIESSDALAMGDMMYKPAQPPAGAPKRRHAERMRRVGERLSGGPMPASGNATDANMEKGLPGMLTLAVGGSANPDMQNAFVMPGKGAAVSKQILDAVASAPIPKN